MIRSTRTTLIVTAQQDSPESMTLVQTDITTETPEAVVAPSLNFASIYSLENVISCLETHRNAMQLPGMYSNCGLSLSLACSILYYTFANALADIPGLPKRRNKKMLLDDHRGDIFLFHKDYVAAGTGPTISFSGQKTIYGAAGQSMGISVQHDDNKAKTGFTGRQYQLIDLRGDPVGFGACLISTYADPDAQWTKQNKNKRGQSSLSSDNDTIIGAEMSTIDANRASKARKVTHVEGADNTQTERASLSSLSIEDLRAAEVNPLAASCDYMNGNATVERASSSSWGDLPNADAYSTCDPSGALIDAVGAWPALFSDADLGAQIDDFASLFTLDRGVATVDAPAASGACMNLSGHWVTGTALTRAPSA